MSHNRRRRQERQAKHKPARLPSTRALHVITQEVAAQVAMHSPVLEPYYLPEMGLSRETTYFKHKPCELPPVIRRPK